MYTRAYSVVSPYTLLFGGIPSSHSISFSEELTVWFVSGGAAAHGLMSFGPLPHPKIHHRNYMDGIPFHAKNHSCLTFQVECSYTVPFPKPLYRPIIRYRQVWRLFHTSKAPWVVVFCWSAKFWYLYGSWFLIVCALHLSGAGWS